MDRIYNGAELEVRQIGDAKWMGITPHLEYRVKPKPEVIHYHTSDACPNKHGLYILCDANIPMSTNVTPIKSKVTCPDCLAILNCKYPGLRKAIRERKEFFVKVTPEQSREVQEIAHSCECGWIYSRFNIIEISNEHIAFEKNNDYSEYVMYSGKNKSNIEFYLSTDSFNSPLPEWVKVGAKCFAMFGISEELCAIDAIKDNRISVSNDKHVGNFAAESLYPAKHQVTYEYLAKLMPFAVRHRFEKTHWITVSELTGVDVKLPVETSTDPYLNGIFTFKALAENYLIKSATETEFHEIGEWVKA